MTRQFPPLCWVGPPLSVWTTGQHDGHLQLARGPYVPATLQDAARIPPAIAAYAIAAYTRPGDTVLDPDCGAGTVLVEALRAGRHTIGITGHRQWRPIACANITAAKRDGAVSDATVLDHPPDDTATHHAGLAGRSDLLLTTWRPTRRPRAYPVEELDTSTGTDTEEDAAADRLHALLARCQPLMRPGSHVIVVLPRRHSRDDLLDLPGHVIPTFISAGSTSSLPCFATSSCSFAIPSGRAGSARRNGRSPGPVSHGDYRARVEQNDVPVVWQPSAVAVAATELLPPGAACLRPSHPKNWRAVGALCR
ncbi:DNA methyltransferase [Streptomyces sp. Inha503]|uniref:DNA methyltransferase n=1 Tax=Streptomyces sp. Inha503 TaxID=3383314 RepID=UPI0039A2A97F